MLRFSFLASGGAEVEKSKPNLGSRDSAIRHYAVEGPSINGLSVPCSSGASAAAEAQISTPRQARDARLPRTVFAIGWLSGGSASPSSKVTAEQVSTAGAPAARVAHATSGRSRLARRFGRELLAGRLATSRLACRLLRARHDSLIACSRSISTSAGPARANTNGGLWWSGGHGLAWCVVLPLRPHGRSSRLRLLDFWRQWKAKLRTEVKQVK